MSLKVKVSKRMKPKVASLGFTREDRESVAAEIADNLDVNEDATDEEIDAAIDTAIDAALPMLKVAQSIKNRAINEFKRTVDPKETEEDDDASTQAGSNKKPQSQGDEDEEPAYFKKFRESQEKRLADLEAKESRTTRKSQLEEALKGVKDTFKSRTLKDYARMNFDNEDEFEEYLEDVKTDAAAFIQEDADRDLSSSHKPGGGGAKKEDSVVISSMIESGTKEIINQSKT